MFVSATYFTEEDVYISAGAGIAGFLIYAAIVHVCYGAMTITATSVTWNQKAEDHEIKLECLRQILTMLRAVAVIQLFLFTPLIYCVVDLGSPVRINALTSFPKLYLLNTTGNGSFVYGVGRPLVGIIVTIFASVCDCHYVLRVVALVGLALIVSVDCLSALQVSDYQLQTQTRSAPLYTYSQSLLTLYISRDLLSIACGCVLLCGVSYLMVTVGVCVQLLTFAQIEGGHLDRVGAMQKQLRKQLQQQQRER